MPVFSLCSRPDNFSSAVWKANKRSASPSKKASTVETVFCKALQRPTGLEQTGRKSLLLYSPLFFLGQGLCQGLFSFFPQPVCSTTKDHIKRCSAYLTLWPYSPWCLCDMLALPMAFPFLKQVSELTPKTDHPQPLVCSPILSLLPPPILIPLQYLT